MLYFGLGDARPYLKRKSDNLNKVLRPQEEYLKSIFCCKWQLVQTFLIVSKVESRKKNESRLVGLLSNFGSARWNCCQICINFVKVSRGWCILEVLRDVVSDLAALLRAKRLQEKNYVSVSVSEVG